MISEKAIYGPAIKKVMPLIKTFLLDAYGGGLADSIDIVITGHSLFDETSATRIAKRDSVTRLVALLGLLGTANGIFYEETDECVITVAVDKVLSAQEIAEKINTFKEAVGSDDGAPTF